MRWTECERTNIFCCQAHANSVCLKIQEHQVKL